MISAEYKKAIIVTLFFVATGLVATHPLIFHLNGFLDLRGYNLTTSPTALSDANNFTTSLENMRREGIIHFLTNFHSNPNGETPYLYYLGGGILMGLFNASGIVAHNIIFIVSVILSGSFMYLLAYRFTKNSYASLFAGFLYSTPNFLINEYAMGHPNYWQIQWLPIIFLFLDKVIMDKHKIKSFMFLGIFLGAQFLSCSHYTVALTFMMPLYIVTRLYFSNSLFKKDTLKLGLYLLLALAISLVVAGWFVHDRLSVYVATRTIQDNSNPGWRLVYFTELLQPNGNLSVGIIPLILLVIGIYFIFTRQDNKFYPFAFIFFISLALIFGISLDYPGKERYMPYYWFYQYWPLVDKFRVPFRLIPFLFLALSLINSTAYVNIMQKFKIKNGLKELLFFIGMMILIVVGYKLFSDHFTQHIIKYSIYDWSRVNLPLPVIPK